MRKGKDGAKTLNPGTYGLVLQQSENGVLVLNAGPLRLYFQEYSMSSGLPVSVLMAVNPMQKIVPGRDGHCNGKIFRLFLKPAMPDMQVVVKPDSPFRLSPGARVKIYTRIPIWITVHTSIKIRTITLMEVPAVELSRTWIGDLTHGKPG